MAGLAPQRCGRDAVCGLEVARECALVVIAGARGDLGDGQGGGFQQRQCMPQPYLGQMRMQRGAVGGAEQRGEVARADARFYGKPAALIIYSSHQVALNLIILASLPLLFIYPLMAISVLKYITKEAN